MVPGSSWDLSPNHEIYIPVSYLHTNWHHCASFAGTGKKLKLKALRKSPITCSVIFQGHVIPFCIYLALVNAFSFFCDDEGVMLNNNVSFIVTWRILPGFARVVQNITVHFVSISQIVISPMQYQMGSLTSYVHNLASIKKK